jgi:CheY-like chemotaxis protein
MTTNREASHGLRENGSATFRLVLLATVLGAVAAVLFAHRRTVGADKTSVSVVQDQTVSSKSPFEMVAQAREQGPKTPLPGPHVWLANEREQTGFAVALLLAIIMAVRKLSPKLGAFLNEQGDPWASAAAGAAGAPGSLPEEEKFSSFVTAFRVGPNDGQKRSSSAMDCGATVHPEVLEEFYAKAATELESARKLFAEVGRATDGARRKEILRELCTIMHSFKGSAGLPGLLPVWQLATTLEGLLDQLAAKPSNATPSALRTVAGALLLLRDLCVPGVRADLTHNPPVHFLAVDDDPISRRAVTMALKKAFQSPDVAENGPTALQLAGQQTYDVIFLDIEMPEMDGFEVCSRIHEIEGNRTTPVVFVTSHSDFDSRAKSVSSGGRDLIAKPFLSFEVTVKALTLLLRSRLDRDKAGTHEQKALPEKSAAAEPASPKAPVPPPTPRARVAAPAPANRPAPKPEPPKAEQMVAAKAPKAGEHAEAFLAHAPEHLRELRGLLLAMTQEQDEARRQEVFGELYVGLHSLTQEAERAELKVIFQLASAVIKLVRKLLEKASASTPSALNAIGTGIQVLENLCAVPAGSGAGTGGIRILVVDDDPIARRAITNALQLQFGKPEVADSGEAALALTQEKSFDVIFLDVLMPGMDGFATCERIRETEENQATPIIFVTSHTDAESREKSVSCGGNGFISKPVLPAEIALTAMTFALRARTSPAEPELSLAMA